MCGYSINIYIYIYGICYYKCICIELYYVRMYIYIIGINYFRIAK